MDVRDANQPNALTDAIRKVLQSVVIATGRSEGEIIKQWRAVLAETNDLRRRLETTSDAREVKPLIDELIRKHDEENEWLLQVSHATADFMNAEMKMKAANAKLNQLKSNRDLELMRRDLEQSNKDGVLNTAIAALNSAQFPENVLADAYLGVGRQGLQALHSSLATTLKADLALDFRVKFYRYRRTILGWTFGVLLFACLSTAISAASPSLSLKLSATVTLTLAVLQYLLNPWFDRIMLKRLRRDLFFILHQRTKAKFLGMVHLMLWEDKVQRDLKRVKSGASR